MFQIMQPCFSPITLHVSAAPSSDTCQVYCLLGLCQTQSQTVAYAELPTSTRHNGKILIRHYLLKLTLKCTDNPIHLSVKKQVQ